ncbi:MAM domain-containing protein 2 [Fukomys damarensis]|uniref:MAM domain-containing protein 2 n=1 Tax=Fukomys damarensis TaxID=885580 RepID=A0A091EF69_FUKDA|nr:MAM domain-containing protein 2 [Fukomys damarensis]
MVLGSNQRTPPASGQSPQTAPAGMQQRSLERQARSLELFYQLVFQLSGMKRQVVLVGGLVVTLRTETRFVPSALQLTGAHDLSAGSCAFEEGTCGFDSVFAFLPWILNEEGHYVYVDTSFAKQGEKAVLLSSELQAEEWSCLRLVYQITTSSGSLSGPSQLNLYVRYEDESFDRLLWSAEEPSDSWLIASLDLQNSSKKFKILIEGILGQGNTASIALFEIKMTTGYCIECDFEENHLCGFVNRWNPNVNWFVGGGTARNSHSILPQDHTFKSELAPPGGHVGWFFARKMGR